MHHQLLVRSNWSQFIILVRKNPEKSYLAVCFIFHCRKLKQQQQINLVPIQFGNHKFSKNAETQQIIEVTRFEKTFIGRQGELEV